MTLPFRHAKVNSRKAWNALAPDTFRDNNDDVANWKHAILSVERQSPQFTAGQLHCVEGLNQIMDSTAFPKLKKAPAREFVAKEARPTSEKQIGRNGSQHHRDCGEVETMRLATPSGGDVAHCQSWARIPGRLGGGGENTSSPSSWCWSSTKQY